ncbi:hypothetical protein [Muricoccus radiodurans]|uniref:hypothetical protein n=1 Tax=Muricoccus radiodurans TaxID=2231721 RepID=UPI003CF1F77F
MTMSCIAFVRSAAFAVVISTVASSGWSVRPAIAQPAASVGVYSQTLPYNEGLDLQRCREAALGAIAENGLTVSPDPGNFIRARRPGPRIEVYEIRCQPELRWVIVPHSGRPRIDPANLDRLVASFVARYGAGRDT